MAVIVVMIFFIPAVASVFFGWWAWHSAALRSSTPLWRSKLVFYSLVSATVGIVLELAFMIREFSFSHLPVPLHPAWLLGAWTSVLTWPISLFGALLGKGKIRWALLLYVVTSVVGVLLFLNLMMD